MEARGDTIGVGARLGRYEILHPLAEGGMAKVWLARAHGVRGFKKLVVLKTIKAQFSDEPQFQEMFLDEARIASGILHPNVAQIIDLGEHEDTLFLAMEWVDGESLSRMRRDVAAAARSWPLGVAMRVVADACAGLHAAHELRDDEGRPLGVVHRDISPHNIMVSVSGAVKVIDFGIAKARNRASGDTSEGTLKGKFAYMSPQQASGAPVDRSVDIWAAGVCLHELLAGRRPFEAESQPELLRRIVDGETTNPLPASVPSPVAEVVLRALAYDPADRFSTALEMQRALEAAMLAIGDLATSAEVAAFAELATGKRAVARQRMLALALDAARARAEAAGEAPSMSFSRIPPPAAAAPLPVAPDSPRDAPVAAVDRIEPLEPLEPSQTQGPSVASAPAPARPSRRSWVGWSALAGAASIGIAVTVGRHAAGDGHGEAAAAGRATSSAEGRADPIAPVAASGASTGDSTASGTASASGNPASSPASASDGGALATAPSAAVVAPRPVAPTTPTIASKPAAAASSSAAGAAVPPKPAVAKPKNEADDDF
jgi:tRNA A-37 threonylcarbamoyl transferase component Bud32